MDYEVESILKHPNFTRASNDDYNSTIYDLALFKLKKPIKFTKYAERARLPKPSDKFKFDSPVKYVGWGQYQRRNNNRSYPLKEADGMLSYCGKNADDYWNKFYMCVIGNDSNPCYGDSGSPLLCKGNYVCGILISVVEPGCNRQGVFTVVK